MGTSGGKNYYSIMTKLNKMKSIASSNFLGITWPVEVVSMEYWEDEEVGGGGGTYLRLRNANLDGGTREEVDLEWMIKPTRICRVEEVNLDFSPRNKESDEMFGAKVILEAGELKAFRVTVKANMVKI